MIAYRSRIGPVNLCRPTTYEPRHARSCPVRSATRWPASTYKAEVSPKVGTGLTPETTPSTGRIPEPEHRSNPPKRHSLDTPRKPMASATTTYGGIYTLTPNSGSR